MSTHDVEVFPGHDALMQAVARRFIAAAASAIADHGRFAVALAGGSTPRGVYERLAEPVLAGEVDWSRVEVFFGDERCVPPDHAESNYRMAREALLDHVPLPRENVHPMHGGDEPEAAAAAYEHELRAVFATPQGPPSLRAGERFDLVLLGLGADGHTASLFPGSPLLHERSRWTGATEPKAASPRRITLTPVTIDAAAEVAFIVSGRSKSAALYRVIEGPAETDALPAQTIVPAAGRLRWMVDGEAAAMLAESRRDRAGDE